MEIAEIITTGENVAAVDLAVGIPSYNEADNISFVVRQVATGLEKYFPHLDSIIVNVDNCSQDGTREAFLQADSGKIPRVYISTPPGITGKGGNFLNLFNYVSSYEPRAVVVVDGDLTSIRPEWIRCLAAGALSGYEFVVPLYYRSKHDGTITNHLCYPLVYALWGRDIRQPIGGEFAISGRLVEHLRKRRWEWSVLQYGIDIFMTSEAVLSNCSMAQVVLGAKVHKPSAPKLGEMFTQVVYTLFSQLVDSRQHWPLNGHPPRPPDTFECRGASPADPVAVKLNYSSLVRQTMEEFELKKGAVLGLVPSVRRRRVEDLFRSRNFCLPAELWVEMVYVALEAFEWAAAEPERRLEIVETLKPLYFARILSFMQETLTLNAAESEERITRQARLFWERRPLPNRSHGKVH